MTLRSIRRFWPAGLVLLFALHGPALQAQEAIRRIEIRHVGPPVASDDMIRAQLRVKVGDDYAEYVRSGSDVDTRSLYGTGLFANIRLVREPRPEGLALVIEVQGKPKLAEISFVGNQYFSANKLLGSVNSKPGQPLDEQKIFSDARNLESLYEKDGYHGTKVQYRLTSEESAGRGSVVFEIVERPKVTILDVSFEGANSFPAKSLRRVIATKQYGLFSWLDGTGMLKEDEVEVDKAALVEFYQNAGYADVEVKEVQTAYPDPSHVRLRFVLSEGAQFRIGNIEVRGNSAFKSEEIVRGTSGTGGLPIKNGELFAPKRLEAATSWVRDFYHRRGYLDTDVRALKVPNTANGTIDIIFEVLDEARGPSYLERIVIRGNTRTKDEVIRRELAVLPGDVFDYVQVRRSEVRVEGTGLFDSVSAVPIPTDIPNRKDLVIDLEEGTTGHMEFGAGFSSVESIAGFIGYRESNFDLANSLRTIRQSLQRLLGNRTEEVAAPYFRGAGQKVRANLSVGTRKKEFDLSFVEPWFLDRKLELGTDFYHRFLNYYSDLYDIRESGASLSLAQPLGSEFVIGRASYTIENIGILNVSTNAPVTIAGEEGERLVSKLGASIAFDTRNNTQLPNHGTRTELETEWAGGVLGGDTDFYKFEFRTSWYFPGLFEGHVIEVRGRAGGVESFGDSKGQPVPLFDRFFLGGTGSLRGYRYRDVGPAQAGEPVGGQTFWFGSVEYSFPLIEQIRLAGFYDIGNVYAGPFSLTRRPGQEAYTDNVGIGFRLNIPHLGPLRFDYGFPIQHDKDVSGGGKFQFSVGYRADY